MIKEASGAISKLQLVKWAFLFSQKKIINSFYQFVPYHHGPFSFNLYHEIDSLKKHGYLTEQVNNTIALGEIKSGETLDFSIKKEINYFITNIKKLSNDDLLNLVYCRYPWYTINARNKKLRADKRSEAKIAVYTAGYEGLQIDGFINLLLNSGIKQLIDVRAHPISRAYGFHKKTLSMISNNLDIKYISIPELGVPNSWRRFLKESKNYKAVFNKYLDTIIEDQTESIDTVCSFTASQPSALMCMESNPKRCHRSYLAKVIAENTDLDIHELRKNE
ncbi:MAG: DUF488 domain-containing protein [Deltaproteobacteria bacterium]|nr:DUF488 domain-containing protein [Deltaproteobacteria bacterium]